MGITNYSGVLRYCVGGFYHGYAGRRCGMGNPGHKYALDSGGRLFAVLFDDGCCEHGVRDGMAISAYEYLAAFNAVGNL